MSSKIFTKNKKRFFLAVFAVAVLGLGFWIIKQNAPEVKASNEIFCYKPGGHSDCQSRDDTYIALDSGFRSTCTVNASNVTGWVAGGAIESCSSGIDYCQTAKCPNDNSDFTEGDLCAVRILDGSTVVTSSYSHWDKSEGKCIQCLDNEQYAVCGSNAGLYLSVLGSCTGLSTFNGKLDNACNAGVVPACDEKAVGAACSPPPGGTCSVAGLCVAANQILLGISASKNPVVVNGTSTLTFTTKKADGTAVNNATITKQTIGCGTLASNTCTTGAGNTCTIVYIAPAAASTCELTFTASAAGYTSGSAAFTFNIVSATFKIVACDIACTTFGPNTCNSKIGTVIAGCGGSPPCIDADGVVKTIIKNDSDCQVGTDKNDDGIPEGYCSKSDIDCSDGTYYNECSSTKPKYCAINANLVW